MFNIINYQKSKNKILFISHFGTNKQKKSNTIKFWQLQARKWEKKTLLLY